jgi:hypothetical protein
VNGRFPPGTTTVVGGWLLLACVLTYQATNPPTSTNTNTTIVHIDMYHADSDSPLLNSVSKSSFYS